MVGIVLGMMAVKYIAARPYNWTGIHEITTMKGRAKRLALQFTPFSFTKYEWKMFTDHRRWFK